VIGPCHTVMTTCPVVGGSEAATDRDVRLIACIRFMELVARGLNLTSKPRWKVGDNTAPEWDLLECSQVKSSDEAKVVTCTTPRRAFHKTEFSAVFALKMSPQDRTIS
jgi:hypothetical protein